MSRKNIVFFILLPLLLFFVSLFWGRYPITPLTVIKVIASKIFPIEPCWADTVETVIFKVRLPRIILALFVGAGLSISGASFQGMFQNPLVSPHILGVCAGAGFGAALGILLSGSGFIIQGLAMLFGLAAVAITYSVSRIYKTTPTLMLVLAGTIVTALFSAFISLTKYVADPHEKLPAIVFWLMGSLSGSSFKDLITVTPPMFLGSTGLLLLRWRINILSMGDREARALGINTEIIKGVIIICSSVVSASAVCVSGIIGWVGLIMPHVARMLVGPDHRVLLPASLVLGGAYLLFIDDLARTVMAAEIPLGILTAIVGAPYFAYILRKTKGGAG